MVQTTFCSVLYAREEAVPDLDRLTVPEHIADLHLDEVLGAMTEGREVYEPAPFFYAPLRDPDAVRYRHEVVRDLERAPVRDAITAFAERMRSMRRHLQQVRKLHHAFQRQSWFVDAAEVYCAAVRSLDDDMARSELASRGLRRLREHVATYAASAAFTALDADVRALKDAFAAIRYAVRIHGARVEVSDAADDVDYGAQVERTFARFQQGAAGSYLVSLRDLAEMDHVEAQIVELVARLQPEPFAARADFCERWAEFVDPTLARFDREVQFYLGYLDVVATVTRTGLRCCLPEVSATSKRTEAQDAFDLALAIRLAPEGGSVVTNDVRLDGAERAFVISGPNNGGKTTFARMFGQVHHLAGLGLPVPGTRARLFLPDRIHTHFEREEDIQTLRGKFEDELVRVRDILDRATSDSVIVMNESFGSTSLQDARFVGTEVMRRVLDLDALSVYVTFVEEIASLSDATVSLVSQVAPADPAERTFKVIRRPADGRAYAWVIAEKYGLTYERLVERVRA